MDSLVVGADMGLIVPAGAFVDPFDIGGGRKSSTGVVTVLGLGGGTEINNSVIPGLAIFVVECFW